MAIIFSLLTIKMQAKICYTNFTMCSLPRDLQLTSVFQDFTVFYKHSKSQNKFVNVLVYTTQTKPLIYPIQRQQKYSCLECHGSLTWENRQQLCQSGYKFNFTIADFQVRRPPSATVVRSQKKGEEIWGFVFHWGGGVMDV